MWVLTFPYKGAAVGYTLGHCTIEATSIEAEHFQVERIACYKF